MLLAHGMLSARIVRQLRGWWRGASAELDAELEHLWGPSSAGPSKAAQDMDEDSQ